MRGAGTPGQGENPAAKVRIRDAAITLFAQDGVAATGVRAIAAAAGVHPSLVIHHFGSKDGLRAACDEHVAAVVRERKHKVMQSGPHFDPLAALRGRQDGPPLMRYLARTLGDGTPHVAALVDEMVSDAVAYLAEGVESGLLRPSAYPYERTVVLTIWSLGALVLHEHLERLLGLDGEFPDDPAARSAYARPVLEMLSEGIVPPDAVTHMKDALASDDEPTDGKRPGSPRP